MTTLHKQIFGNTSRSAMCTDEKVLAVVSEASILMFVGKNYIGPKSDIR